MSGRLTATQRDTLTFMAHGPDDGSIWVSDLAEWAGRSIRASQQRLERLEAAGFVKREPIAWDRGSTVEVWSLTESGWAASTGPSSPTPEAK